MSTLLQKLGEAKAARVHTMWALAACILFFAGLILGLKSHTQPYAVEDDEDYPLAHCIRIVDGDTLLVEWMGNEERIRMLGIDAPETRRTRALRSQAAELQMEEDFLLQYGDIARKTVENWLLDRHIRLVFPEGTILRDNFGRLLCYVELRGTDIGERLLLGGNAITYPAQHPREESYRLFQAEAQKQRRGIWRNL